MVTRTLPSLAAAALALALALAAPPHARAAEDGPCPSGYDTVLSYDALLQGDLAKPASQTQADCYSWQAFLALNKNGPVWRGSGSKWVNKYDLKNFATKPMCNAQGSKIPEDLAEAGGEAVDKIVVWTPDQKYRVYYEVIVNDLEANALSGAQKGKTFTFPVNSIEVKAAWVPVAAVSDPSSFYTAPVEIQDTGGKCKQEQMALVGFHIIRTTANYPGWTWSTFEHKANTPDAANCQGGAKGDCAKDWTFFSPGRFEPSVLTQGYKKADALPNVAEVVRLLDISSLANLNATWQKLAGAPWSNYILVGTQVATAKGKNAEPLYNLWPTLSNTVLETTIQAGTSTQKTYGSCVTCHSNPRPDVSKTPPCNQSFVAGSLAKKVGFFCE